jgi:hypothetical protein
MLQKLRVLATVVCLVLAVAVAVAAVSAGAGNSSRAMALSGSIRPQPDGTYLYGGTIRDLGTGEILARPQVRFADGESATTTIGGSETDSLTLTVSADRSRGTAAVDLSRTEKGRLSTIQHLDFRLR